MLKRLIRPNRVGLIAALTLLAVLLVLPTGTEARGGIECDGLVEDQTIGNVEVTGACILGEDVIVTGNVKVLFAPNNGTNSLLIECNAMIERNVRTETGVTGNITITGGIIGGNVSHIGADGGKLVIDSTGDSCGTFALLPIIMGNVTTKNDACVELPVVGTIDGKESFNDC